MGSRRLDAILARREAEFAEPFYARHRAHLVASEGVNGCAIGCLGATGTVALVTLATAVVGLDGVTVPSWGDAARAAVAVALFLTFAAGAVAASRDRYRVAVLPYFERPVGDTDTFLAGEELLRHSRALDEAAARCGVTPLSAFASGDDLIPGETLTWFDPADALRTTERLLASDALAALPAGVAADLGLLRDSLGRASGQGIRFCLLLREGSFASGHEMSVRRGSFF
jgi:hypothetical protein